MRILASNPDTLGDLVLRQPLYHALLAAGHELALVVRPAVAPLVRYVAPGARVLELPYEAYANDIEQRWCRFDTLFAEAKQFRPDLLLVAPYRWTLFDEKLAHELTGVRTAGMSGHLYGGDPHQGHAPRSELRFDLVAHVEEDAPEFEKNATLAGAVLGLDPVAGNLPPPRLEADEDGRQRAGQILAELGLEPGEYWVACVTGTAHVRLKAWPPEAWAQVLRRWAFDQGRRFLFIGLADEEPTVRAVRQRMGEAAAARTAVWMPPGGTIDELIGLTALGAGYVGHDTGPMHLAAALGKPVLAVFGGGHRLRFQPAAEPSVAVTMGVACAGCEWSCSFATSHCVKAVPVDEVWRAALDLETGRVTGREARVLPPTSALQARMVREAAEFAQTQLRGRAETGRQLAASNQGWARDVADLRQQAEARTREAGELTRQLAARGGEIEHARAALDARAREIETVSTRLAEQDAQLREKEDQIGAQAAAIREQHAVLRERDALLKEQDVALASRSAELAELGAELDRARGDLQLKRQEAGALSARLALHTGELDRVRQEINGMIEQVTQPHAAAGNGDATTNGALVASEVLALSRDVIARQDKELAELREQLKALTDRLQALEPKLKPPRRTLRQFATDLVIGRRHYTPRRCPRPLPSVTIVTPVLNAADTIRDTIESVLGQDYEHLEYVVVDGGSTDGTLDIIDRYKDRIDQIIAGPDAGVFDALAKGFEAATGEVLGALYAGDLMEPGGVLRVAELFARTRAKAAYFDDALLLDGGWRFPAPRRPTPGVYELLGESEPTRHGIYFTANAYRALRGLNRDLKYAADYDWWLRLVRRFGLERGRGHVRSVRPLVNDAERLRLARGERARVRRHFLLRFGLAGRARCTLLRAASRLTDVFAKAPQFVFPLTPSPLTSRRAPGVRTRPARVAARRLP